MANIIFKAYDLPLYSVNDTDKIISAQENNEFGYIPVSELVSIANTIFFIQRTQNHST